MSVIRTSTLRMSKEDWTAAQRESIGGSDAAAVLGLNPWKGPFALWAEKTGAVEPEDISTKEAVRLGTYLEEYVAQRFAEETGKRVRRENAILRNTAYPWAHANVDRMIIGEKAGLECKTTSELNMKRFRGGEYPVTYYCQCMHYMAVTGFPKWYLAVLVGNREFFWYEIPRDEAEISALMGAEEQFWTAVEAREAPAMDGSSSEAEAINDMYQDEGGEADLSPCAGDIQEYLVLKAQIKKLQALMDASADRIKAVMGANRIGSLGGATVSWAAYNSSRLDKAALQAAHPEINLNAYKKVTTARRFEVKGDLPWQT
nr:MAG TPA: Exonuclease [Caudoviricetes sp.]